MVKKEMAKIGKQAPPIEISTWVQGNPSLLADHLGKVILIEIFQVNCPGCFIQTLPQAINLYNKYSDKDLIILGIATAFEDFDKNTLENLELLLKTREVIGETYQALKQHNLLDGNKWRYQIPFPVAMDSLIPNQAQVTESTILNVISDHAPDYNNYSQEDKDSIYLRVKNYLEAKKFIPQTFELFDLQGTPSHILIDRNGTLRHISFGNNGLLEEIVEILINEKHSK